MKLKTKVIHRGVFLMLSILWWFFVSATPHPLGEPDAFIIKLVIWAFFFAGGMAVTTDDSGHECEWQ